MTTTPPPLPAELAKKRSALTVFNPRYEPDQIAPYITVARMASAFDAARTGYTRDMFALYRDIILTDARVQSEMMKRKMAVIGDQFTVRPADPANPDDQDTATYVSNALSSIQGWRISCSHLLDAFAFPVSIIEKVFEPAEQGTFKIASLIPVPYCLLDYATGSLRIFDTTEDGLPLSTSHAADPDRYIVHRGHMFSVFHDQWGGPMRSIVVWWMLANMTREWWARFLERYGSPFTVGYAETADDRAVLRDAFQWSARIGGLIVSPNTRIELQQAAAATTGDAYEKFSSVCYREITRAIVGQTLSTDAQPTGLGSGTSSLHSDVRDDIRALDASMLSETIRDQLVKQLCEINRLPGAIPHLSWGSENPADLQATATLIQSLFTAGIEPDDEAIKMLSDKTGYPLRRAPAQNRAPMPFAAKPIALAAMLPDTPPADLLPLLRDFPAAASQIIRESRSAEECQDRLAALYANQDRRKLAALLADALAVHAAIGASRIKTRP